MDRNKIWSQAKIDAFWDRPKLTYEKWSEKINNNDLRILKQSMLYMNTSDFVDLVGYESIYQVAKRMKRNYRRVYDDVKHLISIGVIKSRTPY